MLHPHSQCPHSLALPSMARNTANLPPEFRAPPPSPAAGVHKGDHRSTEEDELSDYLNRSLRVPQLILPDKILQREAAAPWTPPKLEIGSLDGPDGEVARSAATSMGCFQIVGHGIERELIEEVRVMGGRGFRLPPERKRKVTRSGEREWGFEVAEGPEDEEFFWWCERGDEELAGIWPQGYGDFR